MRERIRGNRVSVYDHRDYRAFLKTWLEKVPEKKRGQLARIAEAGKIHKTTLSQVFSGAKELSLEQACAISQYLGLTPGEAEYFVLLVNFARAGSSNLKEMFRKQIEQRQKDRETLLHRVSRSRELSTEERAIYYSNWMYAAVRNLCAINGFTRPTEIGRRLGIETGVLAQIIEFLVQHGLCVQGPHGLQPGPQMTHLEASSPLVARHHANWRIKAIERHPALRPDSELAYTAPMTLSESDVMQIRTMLADLVERTDKTVGPSPSEKLYCMCLDWFEIR